MLDTWCGLKVRSWEVDSEFRAAANDEALRPIVGNDTDLE